MERRDYEVAGNGSAGGMASGSPYSAAHHPAADGVLDAAPEDGRSAKQLEPVDDLAGTDRLIAAVQVAESLAGLLRELRDEMESAQQRARDMADRARLLEADAERSSSLRERLRAEAEIPSTRDEVQVMAELIDALAMKPSDLLVMVKVSEQAQRLAAVVRAHERVLRILEEG